LGWGISMQENWQIKQRQLMNYLSIKSIVDSWEGVDLSDIAAIIRFRRDLSALYYQLSEYKAQQESFFLTWETERKNHFNTRKVYYIELKMSATEATTRADVDCIDNRQKEVKYEREYKSAKDMLNSLDHILNAMSSAIKVGENEKRQGGYHV
jgi:hypothetical protein